MRFCNVVVAALLVMGWSLSMAQSAEQLRLYSAQVPVADRSEGARRLASSRALAVVLSKLSGSNSVPSVALADAERLTVGYRYLGSGDQLNYEGSFDPVGVARLHRSMNLPLWSPTSRDALVWVAVSSTLDERVQWLADETLQRIIRQALAGQGVAAVFPVVDELTQAQLDPRVPGRLDATALRLAATPYDADAVYTVRWAQQVRDSVQMTGYGLGTNGLAPVTATAQFAVAADAADRLAAAIAADMARELAVAPSFGGARQERIEIINIESPADYAAVLALLEALPLVDRVDVRRLIDGRLEMVLEHRTSSEAIARLIERSGELVATADVPTLDRSKRYYALTRTR